jgi:glycosyltransferase involved in cell wall biosynthesis
MGTQPEGAGDSPSDVALLHHWLVTYRGGEKVLEQFCELFPEAPIGTLVYSPKLLPKSITDRKVITSPLNRVPGAIKHYREMLPLHPWAIRNIKLPESTRFVLSSDAAMVKGVPLPKGARHVCYCHSPPRYLWGLADQYTQNAGLSGRLKGIGLSFFLGYLKRFDYRAAQRVDHFIANSRFVAERIKHAYGKEASVVYPPVDVEAFAWDRPRKPFHLIVSHLVPYKRVDIAVQAYAQLPVELIVIGDGPERKRLEAMATPNVKFLGPQPFARLKDYMETASAFLYPQIEDFGITAVEAQAAGCPVIALRQGGATETVLANETGLFFDEQTPAALVAVSNHLVARKIQFHPRRLRENAERYSARAFRESLKVALGW